MRVMAIFFAMMLAGCTEGGAIGQPSCLLLCLIGGGGGVTVPVGGMP